MATRLEFPSDTDTLPVPPDISSRQKFASPPGPIERVPSWLLLSAICAIGLWIRLHAVAATSFWLDEGMSAMIVRLPWSAFFALLQKREGNMALYYLLLRGWIHLGNSERAIRGMSVFAGVLSLPAIYALGKRLFSARAGLLAALLIAVHAFHLQYSQEARSYSLVILLLLTAAYFLSRAAESDFIRDWLLYVLFSALAVYAHFFAALVVMAQAGSLVFLPGLFARSRLHRRLLRALALLGGLLLPAAWYVHAHTNSGLLDWIPPPSWSVLYSCATAITGAGGAPLLLCFSLACVLAFLPSAPASSNLAPRPHRFPLALVVLWALFPGIFLFALSLHKPLLLARYLSICIPGVVLLAAAGLARLRDRWSLPAAALLVLLSLLGVRGYFAHRWQQDWRGATAYAMQHAHTGDVAILRNGVSRPVFEYYRQRAGDPALRVFSPLPPRAELAYLEFEGEATPHLINGLADTHDRVWTFDWTEDSFLAGLLDGKFHRVDLQRFAGLKVSLYVRGDSPAESR